MKYIIELNEDSGCSDLSEEDKSPISKDPVDVARVSRKKVASDNEEFTFHHNLVISPSPQGSAIYSNIGTLAEYMRMPQLPDQVQCTYVWVDGSGKNMRLKDSTVRAVPQTLRELPIWTFDGSSTGQAMGKNSDVLLQPVALFKDPLRGGHNRLVLCETLDHNRCPIPSNKRHMAAAQMAKNGLDQAEFVIRQQFKLVDRDGGSTTDILCNLGQLVTDACVYAGVKVQPLESEEVLSIGPCRGLEAGDHLHMARFLLHRIAEDFNLAVEMPDSVDPSPALGIHYLEDFSLSVSRLDSASLDQSVSLTLLEEKQTFYDFSLGLSNSGVAPNESLGDRRFDQAIHCTYVWIDGMSDTTRGSTQLLKTVPSTVEDIPKLQVCENKPGQRCRTTTFLLPVAMYQDPFKGRDHKLVLCEVTDKDGKPTGSNLRASCASVMRSISHLEPWFGIEQEYVLFKGPWPLGWQSMVPSEDSSHYCGLGAPMLGRHVSEAHYRACLYAGIKIAGTNAEVLPSQWEFQVGPCEGIAAGDDLWMARFLLHVVAQHFGMLVSFDPKPVPGKCNGSGAHTNFSTAPMREDNGMREIERAIERLSHHHLRHIQAYDPHKGKDNARRLTGSHETARIDAFSSGIANRAASIRIPQQVALEGKGYFEDRRPSANCDPYSVTEVLVRTAVLGQ